MDELRANPGRWARVKTCPFQGYQYGKAQAGATSTASRIRRGGAKYWQPKGAFEAVSRRVNNAYCVYARYVGEGGAK